MNIRYSTARLWLGFANIGVIVFICFIGLLTDLPGIIDAIVGNSISNTLLTWVIMLVIYILVSLPFDFLGGYFIPKELGRIPYSFITYIKKWLRASLLQAFILFIFGTSFIVVHKLAGNIAVILLMILFVVLLISRQLNIAQIISGLSIQRMLENTWLDFFKPDLSESNTVNPYSINKELKNENIKIRLANVFDPAFVGGFSGIPGTDNHVLVMPKHWYENFKPKQWQIALLRRLVIINNGSQARGVWWAAIANVLLFSLGVILNQFPLHSVSGWMHFVFTYSLFTGLLMLVLSFPQQLSIFAADNEVLTLTNDKENLTSTIIRIEKLQPDRAVHNTPLQTLLYPIPDIDRRIKHMNQPPILPGAWQIARLSPYYSWAGCSLLGRVSHAAIGKPDLWVFLPGD